MTTGQKLDRLQVLDLKIRAHGLRPHWVAERAALEASYKETPFSTDFTEAQLLWLNQRLWTLTDEQAAIAKGPWWKGWFRARRILCDLYRYNQQRHKAIHNIDILMGEYKGEEK